MLSMNSAAESGFLGSIFIPGMGRVLWGVVISFVLLATTTQFGNGKKKFQLSIWYISLNISMHFRMADKVFEFEIFRDTE